MNETTIKILRETKDRLFAKGWRKGDFGSSEGPNCILGAIEQVTRADYYFHNCDQGNCPKCQVTKALKTTNNGSNLAMFNDFEGTSFDDIVNLIDRTIKNLEAE